jgi:hypothetical protein
MTLPTWLLGPIGRIGGALAGFLALLGWQAMRERKAARDAVSVSDAERTKVEAARAIRVAQVQRTNPDEVADKLRKGGN